MRTIFILWILFLQVGLYSQSRWVEPILENDDVFSHDLFESYDHGYLLLGWYGSSYPSYSWLIKTDINGDLLWHKIIGENNSLLGFDRLTENPEGKVYISGTTSYYDPYRDPIVLKLNECGEKEWCRVFYTPGNYDYSRYILTTESGGCVVLLNNTGPDSNYYGVRVSLAELNSDGELIWQTDYNSEDSSFQAEIIVHVLKTIDSGYLLTGLCDFEDPSYPGLFWTHPYFIKFDSVGLFEWEKVVNKETPSNGGAAWSTVINPDSTFFYSSISHYYYAPTSSSPALVKMDFEGNVIDIYDVVSGYKEGKLSYATFINTSTLAASAGWGNNDDSLWSRAVIIDTLGNLLNSRVLIEDLYTSILEVAYDGKLGYLSNTFQNNQFDCYLTKLNQDLGQDTIYTMPFAYDSLCPYQIVSDTIVQDDCGLIVGVPDDRTIGRYNGKTVGLEVWPNPCSSVVSISLTSRQSVPESEANPGSSVACPEERSDFRISRQSIESWSIEIYDIFGRKVSGTTFSPLLEGRGRGWGTAWTVDDGEWRMDVSALPSGLYLMVVKDGAAVKASAKFVVGR